ncbi:hypothetical protein BN440_1663 [Erwinia amylovora MR1]|nr:hypothetical protein BN440_1663 [Erwinia amylovora MR1]
MHLANSQINPGQFNHVTSVQLQQASNADLKSALPDKKKTFYGT